MAKRPSNIYSWALARTYHHNNRFKTWKKVDFKDVATIIDRAETYVKDISAEAPRPKDILDNQVFRVKKYFRIIRQNGIRLDMTDSQSHLDYDLLPVEHSFSLKRGK